VDHYCDSIPLLKVERGLCQGKNSLGETEPSARLEV
jgi:hypothetical protein